MTDITTFIELVIAIAAAVIGVLILPWLVKKVGLDTLYKVTQTICAAAEEAGRTGLIEKKKKHEYATKLIRRFLGVLSVFISDEKLSAIIDAVCYDLFNQFKDDELQTPSEDASEE